MKGFWSVVLDENSQPVSGCSIYVYTFAGVLATLYSDENGITPKNNPLTSDDYGRYSFFVTSGKYYLTFVKTGLTSWTSDYITIPDEVDETDTDTTKNKYVSNALMKGIANDLLTTTKKNVLYIDNLQFYDKEILWLIKDKIFGYGVNKITVGTIAPLDPKVGDLWIDTT